MSSKTSYYKKRLISLLIYTTSVFWFFSGCMTQSTKQVSVPSLSEEPVVERLNVNPSPSNTIVEVINSGQAPYTVFKLADPLRVVVDIRGKQGGALPAVTMVNDGNIGEIQFEEGKTQSLTTRMTALLKRDVDYTVSESGNIIRLSITPKERIIETQAMKDMGSSKEQTPVEPITEKVVASEPRIMFQPKSEPQNQVLGIDFTMLDHGKSRLIVTTKKKVGYDLDRKGENSLNLKLSDIAIPSLLLREIDASHFQSAIYKVAPEFSPSKKEVSLIIDLKEMVPFHIKQTDKELYVDFGKTSVKTPEKKIVPINLAETQTMKLAAKQETGEMKEAPGAPPSAQMELPAGQGPKGFSGEPMYLDFVDADVTHILRLINEVSEENIIWDPEIAGRKVSMILKNVPWDEALELILQNNSLAKRYVGKNILWITTKAKMDQIRAEEEAEERKVQKRIEDELARKKAEEKKAVEEQPLITEYLPVDFASADEIRDHITLTERGKLSIDTRTNTIIIKDTADSIKEAKETVKQFDTPVKQIMIEARIVDASDDLTRDLGIVWGSNTTLWRKNNDLAVTVPANAVTTASTTGLASAGQQVFGGSFTTNAPTTGWAGNIGLNFARLTTSGLGAITLDATLALAETEGKSKTISAPKVIAREGTSATISSGDTLVIPATENVASTTLDATLSLTVTPTAVSYNDFITLEVNVTDDQAPSSTLLTTKNISTTLMVKSGDTVVIGGILKESETDSTSGIPLLKDIPGLGWLFKANNKVKQKSELLIFLTPKVLPSPVKTL